MTCGIYILKFKEPNDIYIGQSICIRERCNRHLRDLRNGKAVGKLLKAYEIYGEPEVSVLEECGREKLDEREIYYIDKFDSFMRGLNSTPGGQAANGYKHNSAKFDKETYETIFHMLAYDHTPLLSISKELEVPANIVKSISTGKSHEWLRQDYPELWPKVLANNSLRGRPNMQVTNERYVIDPDGVVHTIFNRSITRFSEIHGLSKGQMSALLLGSIASHRGWRLFE